MWKKNVWDNWNKKRGAWFLAGSAGSDGGGNLEESNARFGFGLDIGLKFNMNLNKDRYMLHAVCYSRKEIRFIH